MKFIDGFVPSEGDSLRMLEIGGGVTGQFSEVRVEGLPEGQAINVDPVTGLVSVGAALGQPHNLCGAGLCGAGGASLFWMSVCALCVIRPVFRRILDSEQKYTIKRRSKSSLKMMPLDSNAKG